MYIQQLYTNCLAQAAYYVESDGEAAVIDPLRDLEQYLSLANEKGAKIKYVLETHFHADFVSGHVDLANKAGAIIVFGPGAEAGYKVHVATDGEELIVGKCKIKVLHTPGHTVESCCYLLYDEQGMEAAVFTGDTLFVNEVGRPDLMSGNKSKEELASMLFQSLQEKIKPLPEGVVVYPGHGPGSACGKNIGIEKQSTIGHELQHNYALLETDKGRFIATVTNQLPIAPAYFFADAALNKQQIPALDEVVAANLTPLTPEVVRQIRANGITVLDTRSAQEFALGHIPGSVNVGLNGDFAVWVGTLLPPKEPMVLVTNIGKEKESIIRLARIGYDHVTGYLDGGINAWGDSMMPLADIKTLMAAECAEVVNDAHTEILDVRNTREVAKSRVPGAIHVPLNMLSTQLALLNPQSRWLVYCAGGYRSMVAASLMKQAGFEDVYSLEGGINALLHQQPELVELELNEQE
jgi:hydroxyacylglutathione hydrolase